MVEQSSTVRWWSSGAVVGGLQVCGMTYFVVPHHNSPSMDITALARRVVACNVKIGLTSSVSLFSVLLLPLTDSLGCADDGRTCGDGGNYSKRHCVSSRVKKWKTNSAVVRELVSDKDTLAALQKSPRQSTRASWR